MKKLTLAIIPLLLILTSVQAQNVKGTLAFSQGQSMDVTLDVKTTVSQVVMGQAIDFNVEGTAVHNYKVTNATNDNTTLRHSMKRIRFNFEGMGQKLPFDSDNQKDMEGQLGKPFKETLSKTYDMIIDPSGKVMMVQPEKIEPVAMDERLKLASSLLKDVLDVVQPPQKNSNSFFRVLPEQEVVKGHSWTENLENESGKYSNIYTVNDINDSTIVVGLNGTSTTTSKLEIMGGMELITSLNNKTTGTILLDRNTRIIKQQINNIESNGTTQVMGSETPITSKSTVTINVKQ